MTIALIGSGGRLGAALARGWSRAGDEVIPFNHEQLDLASRPAIETVLRDRTFDVLVNCAALTNVDYCETHEPEAMRVNAEAVRDLAEICARRRVRMIQISTDSVFDGKASAPYHEDDLAEPINVYGESKQRGEIELLSVSPANLAVRVSWVFGPDRPSFVDHILKRALESDAVEAISDKYASPTYSEDVAAHLRPFLRDIPEGGLLHLCNVGESSWHDYAEHAIRCAIGVGVSMKTDTVRSIPMAEMQGFVAKRPPFSVLATDKLARLSGCRPRSWQSAVEEYVWSFFAQRHRS